MKAVDPKARQILEASVGRMQKVWIATAATALSVSGWSQTVAPPLPDSDQAVQASQTGATANERPANEQGAAGSAVQGEGPASPARKIYTVPAGTKVLLQLRSAVNTKSAKPGDGVYLASTFPVVVGTRVLIPAGVYVQGIVDSVVRPGRVKGRAQLNLHFTSMIFPNGSVVEVPGIINSLPGAHDRSVDAEGKVEQNSSKGHDVAEAAKIGLEGAGVGTIGGAAAGHPLEGLAIGGLGGAAVGAAVALFTRGNDINIENGTPVEMVLQRPLILEETNLSTAPGDGYAAGSAFYPAQSGQPRRLDKPGVPRAQVICPPGGLGCQ